MLSDNLGKQILRRDHSMGIMKKTALSTLFLLAAAACGGAQTPQELDSPRSEVPAELAGRWFTGTLSTIQYYDSNTGQFLDPNGSGFYVIIGEDASYESGAVIDSTVAGCTARLLGHEIGTVTVDGDKLTMHRAWVKTTVKNQCGYSGDNQLGPETKEATWTAGADDQGRPQIQITDGFGTSTYHAWE